LGYASSLRELPFQDMAKESVAGKYQMLHGYSLGWISAGLHHVCSTLWQGAVHDQSLAVQTGRVRSGDGAILAIAARPAATAAAKKMTEIARTYVPMFPTVDRIDFTQPWLMGFAPSQFGTYWKYLDIDLACRGTLSWWTQALVVRQRLDGAARALRVESARGRALESVLAAIERHRCDAPLVGPCYLLR
jgi:hypothetical protein